MGLTDKHLAYGDDIPKTQAEKDYYWELKNLKEKQQVPKKSADMTREEAIKVLEMFLYKQCDLKRTEFAYDQNTVWAAVNMASEALEQTTWIPVSERSPEDGTYLVTVERMDGETRIDMKSFAKDLNKVDEFDFPKHKCGWYDYDSEYGFWEDTKVIAWMPLPEPYKAESEDKEE